MPWTFFHCLCSCKAARQPYTSGIDEPKIFHEIQPSLQRNRIWVWMEPAALQMLQYNLLHQVSNVPKRCFHAVNLNLMIWFSLWSSWWSKSVAVPLVISLVAFIFLSWLRCRFWTRACAKTLASNMCFGSTLGDVVSMPGSVMPGQSSPSPFLSPNRSYIMKVLARIDCCRIVV